MTKTYRNWADFITKHSLVQDYWITRTLRDMGFGQFACLVVLLGLLYIGAGGAYMLGVVLTLPPAVVSLFTAATVVHLTGQMTFILVIGFVVFKVSRPLVQGALFSRNFLICKFYIGPKKKDGLRDVAVMRLQRRLNYKAIERKRFIFIAALICALLFIHFTFLRISSEFVTIYAISFLLLFSAFSFLVMFLLGSISALNDADDRPFTAFIKTTKGMNIFVSVCLAACAILGASHTLIKIHGPLLYYPVQDRICAVSPMMPVYGGDLYYERSRGYFLVISSGRVNFVIPRFGVGPVASECV